MGKVGLPASCCLDLSLPRQQVLHAWDGHLSTLHRTGSTEFFRADPLALQTSQRLKQGKEPERPSINRASATEYGMHSVGGPLSARQIG